MAGGWFFHKTRTEKALKFGVAGAAAPLRPFYAAPRPTRHLPSECRLGWLCNERGRHRPGVGRRHLLARPVRGSAKAMQSVVAQLLPSLAVAPGDSPIRLFELATDQSPVGPGEVIVGQSEVRRVRIEETGVIALERTRCTQSSDGSRIVTLFWAIHVASEKTVRMALICAEGEAELRTYRTQVADFLRRWTATASCTVHQKSYLLR